MIKIWHINLDSQKAMALKKIKTTEDGNEDWSGSIRDFLIGFLFFKVSWINYTSSQRIVRKLIARFGVYPLTKATWLTTLPLHLLYGQGEKDHEIAEHKRKLKKKF